MKRSFHSDADKRLKMLRRELKMTQEEMAEVLELSPRYVAQIESGERNMSAATLYRACSRLSISADYLLLGKSENQSASLFINILDSLDNEYLPLAEELLKTLVMFEIKKQENEKKK